MGGFTSEVDGNTKNIALESAYFTPQTTRKSARSVGLRTEASARFERGVDMGSVKPALMRAMQLMQEFADAKIIGISETGENKLPDIDITLRFSEIKRILGTEIPEFKCVEILENLGFETLGRNTFSAKFRVPSYRINDVTREIDLIEEISRIHGYDKIETTLPKNTQPSEVSNETKTKSAKYIKNVAITPKNDHSTRCVNHLVKYFLVEGKTLIAKTKGAKIVKIQKATYLRRSKIPNLKNI